MQISTTFLILTALAAAGCRNVPPAPEIIVETSRVSHGSEFRFADNRTVPGFTPAGDVVIFSKVATYQKSRRFTDMAGVSKIFFIFPAEILISLDDKGMQAGGDGVSAPRVVEYSESFSRPKVDACLQDLTNGTVHLSRSEKGFVINADVRTAPISAPIDAKCDETSFKGTEIFPPLE